MRKFWSFAIVGLTVALSSPCQANDQTKAAKQPSVATAAPASPDVTAIRGTEATFKKAFDSGDAQAIAAHWTADGEYIDESGKRIQGREAIAKEYAAFFAANPGARITSHIDRLRVVNADTAIEDGTAKVEAAPGGGSTTSRYTVVHVKQGDKWLMCSVRDSQPDASASNEPLGDFSWLIGKWTAETGNVKLELNCRWIADKKFIEQRFETRRGEQVVSSGTQIIGWDPGAGQVKSWTFSSDGGHAVGSWTPQARGWIVEATGTMVDGTPTSAVNILTGLDDNGFAWRSVNRNAGEFRVLDTNEVILRRAPAARK